MKKVIAGKIGGIMLALLLAIIISPAFTQESSAANGEIGGSGTEAEPYLIEDAQDLVKMATDVNSGTNAEGYYKLANDIDLSTVCGADVDGGKSWTPIGNRTNKFKGTFDGDGHKITGLYISAGTGYQGLFGYAEKAAFKRFMTEGTVASTSGADNGGVIGNAVWVTMEDVGNGISVDAKGNNTGGLIGNIASGTYGTEAYGKPSTLTSCYNKGEIYSTGNDVGGLVGYANEGVTIDKCYNAGKVTSATTNSPRAAGFISNIYSYAKATVTNSFNYGEITGNTKDVVISAYSSQATYAPEVTNVYYLENSGSSSTAAVSKTVSEFKSLAATLGEGWSQGDDYPILPFEYIKGKASVEGAAPARQQVTQGETAQKLTVTATGDTKLDADSYTLSYQWYEAGESDLSDAKPINGATSDEYTPQIAADMIAGDYYYYCVVKSTSKDGSFDEVETVSAAARIDVVSTTEAAIPSITISKDPDQETVGQGNKVTFKAIGSVEGAGAGTLSYEWYKTSNESADIENDEKVGTGETYEFTAEDLGDVCIYCVATNTFENVKKATAASELSKLTVVGKEISTAEELAALASEVNAGSTYAGRIVTLAADIDLSEIENWTPIGNSSTNSFKGTFEGAGHAITGLNITGTDTYRALFGYINGATLQNFTVSGNVSGGSYTAGIVAYASGNNTITNVGNNAAVSSSGSNAGGIVGYIPSGKTTFSNSYNKGSVTLTGTGSRVGGIVGSAGSFTSTGKITSCYNTGDITTSAKSRYSTYAGGLSGSNCPIDNSYSTGEVKHPGYDGTDSYAYALVGNASAPTCTSPCYWLETAAQAASGGSSSNLISKTSSEMKSEDFVTALNTDAFAGTWISGSAVEAGAQDYPGLKWEGKKLTVTYVLNDGTDAKKTATVFEGEKATKPEDPTREGYAFIEWQDADGNAFDFENTEISENITLTAVWGHTVTFDSNGGSEVAAATVKSGEKATVPEEPTRDGYTFVQWQDADGNAFDFENTEISEDITLTAAWGFKVTFDSAGGSEVEPIVVAEGELAVEPEEPTREDFFFDGWQLDNEPYDFSSPVNSEITLRAKWKTLNEIKDQASSAIDEAAELAKGSEEEGTAVDDETAAKIDREAAAAKAQIDEMTKPDNIAAVTANAVGNILDAAADYAEAKLTEAKKEALQAVIDSIEHNKENLDPVAAAQMAIDAIVAINNADSIEAVDAAKTDVIDSVDKMVEDKKAADEKAAAEKKAAEQKAAAAAKAYNKAVSVAKAKKVAGFKVKAKKGKKARATWKKTSGVSGYEIYRATKKNGKYKKIKVIKKAGTKTFTNKKLKAKKKYFYKIGPYTMVKNTSGKMVKVYGKYSAAKKIKARK